MAETTFIRVEEIVKELDISEASAYKLIRTLNEELKQKGLQEIMSVTIIVSAR